MGLGLKIVNEGEWASVRRNFQRLNSILLGITATPTFSGLTLTDLTANSLIYTPASKALTSLGAATNGQIPIGSTGVAPVLATITGTANEIDVTNAAGSITIGIVNPLIVGKGGTGVATLTDHGLLLGSGTDAVTPLGAATNGQLPIGSTGADPVLATLSGTSNQITVTPGAGSITLSAPQNIHTAATPTFAGLTIVNAITEFSTDGTLTDNSNSAVPTEQAVKTYVDVEIAGASVAYKYIKATGQAEGDLHLSDVTNWNISKALIKYVRIITSSSSWDLYILQNDNGYVANDAAIPAMKIGDGIIGNATLFLDLPYQDEDASNEVHLYWLDNSGANTATIIIQGYSLS